MSGSWATKWPRNCFGLSLIEGVEGRGLCELRVSAGCNSWLECLQVPLALHPLNTSCPFPCKETQAGDERFDGKSELPEQESCTSQHSTQQSDLALTVNARRNSHSGFFSPDADGFSLISASLRSTSIPY